jgi:hypothetical protein
VRLRECDNTRSRETCGAEQPSRLHLTHTPPVFVNHNFYRKYPAFKHFVHACDPAVLTKIEKWLIDKILRNTLIGCFGRSRHAVGELGACFGRQSHENQN